MRVRLCASVLYVSQNCASFPLGSVSSFETVCCVCVGERERNCDRVSMLDCLQSHLTMVMCSSAITNCGHRDWLGPAIIDRRRLYDRQEEPPLFHSTRNVQCACVLFATSTKNPIPWHSNVQINTSKYRKIDK